MKKMSSNEQTEAWLVFSAWNQHVLNINVGTSTEDKTSGHSKCLSAVERTLSLGTGVAGMKRDAFARGESSEHFLSTTSVDSL